MSALKPIPTSECQSIAEAYGARQVIIWAWDRTSTQHVTTYGVTSRDKEEAARAGNAIKAVAGWSPEECDAWPAPLTTEMARLRAALESARDKIRECADRLQDAFDAIKSENVADEGDLEAEQAYIADVRAFAEALGG